MDYKKAIEFVVKRRDDELYAARLAFERALEQDDELAETEREIKRLTLTLLKDENSVTCKENKNSDTILKKLKKLEKEKKEKLKKLGLTEKVLNPPPHCTICGDKGILPGGKICVCAKSLAINDGENVSIPLHKFSDANMNLYGDMSEHNKSVLENVQKILEKFPNNKKRNIVLLGGTGTGKTFLSGCAAEYMLSKGQSVTAVTAFEFVQRALSYHTTFDDKKDGFIRPLLDSALLIIDDLGTESIFKNITLEYIYTVLNERMYKNKLTLFTSNLSADGILARYGERIYSRLFDKALSYASTLIGDDLRLKKR